MAGLAWLASCAGIRDGGRLPGCVLFLCAQKSGPGDAYRLLLAI